MSTKISEVLRGCTPEPIQTVGFMQIIPLVSDVVDDAFAIPTMLQVSTSHYGEMVFQNEADAMAIVPAHSAYIVKQSAQDHAMTHVGLLKSKGRKTFKTAACIQEAQGGYIRSGDHELRILPVPLREKAHSGRNEQSYNKLWPSIRKFNESAGLTGRGHLEDFVKHFHKELDEFQAEFEPVDHQVGAIVLVNGVVVGVERVPNYEYWLSVWVPLVRDCYGSLAIIESKRNKKPEVPKTRIPLRKNIRNLAELEDALSEAKAKEYSRVRDMVNAIVDNDVDTVVSSKLAGTKVQVEDLDAQQFVGQIVRHDKRVIYVSVVTTETWRDNKDWFEATRFSM